MFRDLVGECKRDYHEYCTGDFKPDDIVISGMAGRFPACDNVKEFKEGIYTGKELLVYDNERIPKGPYNNQFGSSGCIKNLDKFEVDFFCMSHNIIHSMDPGCRKLLEVTYEAFADAGYDLPSVSGANIGIYNANISSDSFVLGCMTDLKFDGLTWARFLNANRITYFFNLLGPSLVVDTACSSSLTAFNAAYNDLKDGKIDGAIVNSCQINLLPEVIHFYSKIGIISPTYTSTPFDARANGIIRSEGVVAVFLQKASTARRVYASVLSSAFFSAGFAQEGISVPSVTMQENLNRHVLKMSGLHPDQIDFIEAHGTGTDVGDFVELSAIERVYCTSTRKKPIYVGSVKSNIGHSEASAGLIGIVKALLAMEEGNVAPNYDFRNPNPNVNGLMTGSMKVVSKITPLSSPYIPVNSFGLGGTLLQTVLKQNNKTYPSKSSSKSKIPRLSLVSGTCQDAVQFLIDYIKSNSDLPDEFFALLNKISFCRPKLKPYRGYILSQKESKEILNITQCTEEKRPIWFIYAGMGCQWRGMGEKLMDIDIFASAMKKCAEVIKPYGIDLLNILRSDSDLLEHDRRSLPAFVSIAAIQIALTNVLHHIGIQPDGIAGHSTGEIGASYGDGCCSLEETMLLALNRGLSIDGTPELAHGAMAATALSWKQAQELCPPNVFASCHNADDSVTISGLKDDVEKFVEKLKKQNIFAALVNAYGYAFHSKYIKPASEKLRSKKAIKIPKQRTKRWLSSSVPETEWKEPRCQIVGNDYFVNNLISPVRFNEVIKKIPPNAITIEIAPHHQLQSILRKSVGPKSTNLALMKRNELNGVNFLLESIGKMYQLGLDPQVEKLYPPVQFPVPRNTPCISDLIKWNHSISFKVRKWEPQTGESSREYNLNRDDSYLLDHFIDGRSLFPAAGYIVFAWEMLAKKQQKSFEDLPIIIENFKIHRATVINQSSSLKLSFNLLKDSKSFEIFEGHSIVASGEINEWNNRKYCEPEPVFNSNEESTVDGKDIYNDLRIRGYEYGPEFQALTKMSLDGSQYLLRWENRWIPFLDSCLLTYILANYDDFVLPTAFLSLKIDPNVLKTKLASDTTIKELPVNLNRNTNICRSVGIEFENLTFDSAPRRKKENPAILEAHHFIPYEFQYSRENECEEMIHQYMNSCNELLEIIHEHNDKLKLPSKIRKEMNTKSFTGNHSIFKCLKEISENGLSTNSAEINYHLTEFGKDPVNSAIAKGYVLKIMLDIIAENTFQKLNVTEISSRCSLIMPHIVDLAKKNFHLRFKKYTLLSDDENLINNGIQSDINVSPLSSLSKFTLERKEDVVVSSFYSGSSTELRQLIETLCSILAKDGFIILYHKEKLSPLEKFLSEKFCKNIPIQTRSSLEQFFKENKLVVLSCARDSFGSALYLLRPQVLTEKHCVLKITESLAYSWVEELKKCIKQSDNDYLWLVSEDDLNSGIIGMVNCLKQEPGGEKIRCVFVSPSKNERKPPPFSLEQSFYKSILTKSLVMNVWRDNNWGSFRHIILPENKQPRNVEHSYVRCKKYGDLSSFEWVESLVKYVEVGNSVLAHIYYSAINFKDVMLATGKLSEGNAKLGSDSFDDSLLGLEFSGRDEKGRRIAGITTEGRGMATATIVNPVSVIDVPDEWSLEEAATVPVVYATALYALVVRAGLCNGQSILIHSATGGVGLAATRIAIHYGCEIFLTVGTAQKRNYLRKLFPQLKEENIASSRNKDFELMIKNRTEGKGVDIVLNSLADDKFQASVRCVAKHGHFLEIGKYDLSLNRNLGLKVFLKNITFHAIMLDELFENTPHTREKFSKVMNLVREGIRSGLVKPLDRTVFKRDEVEAAFRYMAKGIHVGKVLLKIRDEEQSKATPPKSLILQAIPNTYFYPKKTYIVIGGLGGFGIEVTKWILTRGGKNIVITSRKGVSTPHQRLWLKKWNRKGNTVQVLTLDVSKSNEAEQLLREASNFGAIGGVFNSAVVLKDAFIDCQNPETFKEVCAPKAVATKILDKLTRKMCPDLDFFVCFSSVSSGRGNAGQTNYGYANSVMERICEERRKSGLHGLSIQWGVIGDVGVVYREMKNDAMIAGVRAQSIQSCLETLDTFCQFEHPVLSSHVTSINSKARKSQNNDVFNQITKLVGMTETTGSFLNRQFGEMGLDSLLSVEIKQLIENKLNLTLTMQELFQMKFEDIKKLAENEQEVVSTSIKLPATLTYLDPIISFNNKGLENPVFIVSLGLTKMSHFQELAEKLNKPMYVLTKTKSTPLSDMDSLSSWFLNIIRSKVSGPFHLLGYSLSSSLAFDMAIKDEASSKKVQSITLIDGSRHLIKSRCKVTSSEDTDASSLCEFIEQFSSEAAVEVENVLRKAPTVDDKINVVLKALSSSSTKNKSEIVEEIRTHLKLSKILHSYAAKQKLSKDILLVEDPTKMQPNNISELTSSMFLLCSGKITIKRLLSPSDLAKSKEVENLISALRERL